MFSVSMVFHPAIAVAASLAMGCCANPTTGHLTAKPIVARQSHADLLVEARALGPRDCSKDTKFGIVNGALGGAVKQMNMGDYRRANIRLRDGLEALGDIDLGSDVLDDSEQHLSLAWSQEWNGQLKLAAVVRRNMLTERLAEYAELQNLKGCPSPAESADAPVPPPGPE